MSFLIPFSALSDGLSRNVIGPLWYDYNSRAVAVLLEIFSFVGVVLWAFIKPTDCIAFNATSSENIRFYQNFVNSYCGKPEWNTITILGAMAALLIIEYSVFIAVNLQPFLQIKYLLEELNKATHDAKTVVESEYILHSTFLTIQNRGTPWLHNIVKIILPQQCWHSGIQKCSSYCTKHWDKYCKVPSLLCDDFADPPLFLVRLQKKNVILNRCMMPYSDTDWPTRLLSQETISDISNYGTNDLGRLKRGNEKKQRKTKATLLRYLPDICRPLMHGMIIGHFLSVGTSILFGLVLFILCISLRTSEPHIMEETFKCSLDSQTQSTLLEDSVVECFTSIRLIWCGLFLAGVGRIWRTVASIFFLRGHWQYLVGRDEFEWWDVLRSEASRHGLPFPSTQDYSDTGESNSFYANFFFNDVIVQETPRTSKEL